MESVHVKLDYFEAVSAKKDLLGCEASLLEIIKKIRAFKLLRRKEFSVKAEIKKSLDSFKKELIRIGDALPEDEEVESKKLKSIKKIVNKNKRDKDLESELDEIKEKLARLG